MPEANREPDPGAARRRGEQPREKLSAALPGSSSAASGLVRRHLVFGWWSLLAFLALGIMLEGLHGFKVGWYLDVSNSTRRFMWTLAHAHGTLLSLICIAFALTIRVLPARPLALERIASPCLLAANLLLPLGFFLGGLFIHGGDPGLGVLLVPVGAVLLLLSVFVTARAAGATRE
jgi:hypothetical protein